MSKKKKSDRHIVLYDEGDEEISRVKIRKDMSDREAVEAIEKVQPTPKGHKYKVLYGKRGGFEMEFSTTDIRLSRKRKSKKLRM